LSVVGSFYAVNALMSATPFSNGAFITLSSAGPSGIGVNTSNPFAAYVATDGNWFTGSLAGDTAYRNTAGRLLFGTSDGAPNLVISTTGNVGIGTTNPGYKLEVSGNIHTSGGSF
jgi:hypothetical protein